MTTRTARLGVLVVSVTMLAIAAPFMTAETAANARDTVSLRSAVIDAAQAAATAKAAPGASIQLVKLPGPPTAGQREALERAVERVYTYLPHDAFLVRVGEGGAAEVIEAVGASWTAPYLPDYKISPEIAETRADDATVRPVMIHVFPDVDLGQTVAAIERLAGKEVEAATDRTRFARARILLSGAEIVHLRQGLANLDEVFWLEREARKVFTNDTTIWVGQSGTSGGGATPVFDQGILGANQVVGVLDTGIDIDSCYFRDSGQSPALNQCDYGTAVNTNHRKVIAVDFLWSSECSGGISNSEWDTHDHGTHVAGTVAGDDFAVPGQHNGRDGMAPQAKLVIQDCGYQYNECADCPGIGCPVIDLNPVFEQPYDQGARIHTNSWGDEEEDPAYGEYTAGSEDADNVMWNHKDYLLLFAAGNNGGSSNTVDSPSTAKSVISVGATEHASGADSIAYFSSRGPTDDGRIKPSITIVGADVMSASNDGNITTNNCNDQSMSGTSMASPGAAGLAALVRQYYSDGWYPSGAANAPDAFTPSAALLRASLVNSGEQMTGEGTIPNNTQGWGRILLDNVLFFAGEGRRLWLEDNTVGFANGSSGETHVYQLNVASGIEPLEVTLAWTDYPSTPAASPNINNDLDLRVSGPDGTFLGNVFSGGHSTTGGSADRLNTLENVLVISPTPGLWSITVESFTVPDGPQPYAVVATGDLVPCSGVGNAAAVAGSEDFTPSGGDGDAYLDNCESATVSFTVANSGSEAATNVTIVSVVSPSHPATVFADPVWTAASIAGCGTDDSAYLEITQADGLVYDDTLLIDVEITNDEISPATNITTLSIPATETDVAVTALVTYDFETDHDGWTVQSGTFDRDNTLGPPGGSWCLRSSIADSNACDVVESPEVVLSETSTLSISTYYDIEDGPTWYDRANISLLDGASSNVIEPDGGRLYDVPSGSSNGTCDTGGEAGWAGSATSWVSSTFSASALGSAAVAGRPVSFDIHYGTDGYVHPWGFAFDMVQLTDVMNPGPDAQSDECTLYADLTIHKTDGSCYALPGEAIDYTITVTNGGPEDVIGATVEDLFPPELGSISWTCTPAGGASCTASGNGDIDDSADLPVGASAVYSAHATIDSGASGVLINTASVTVPAGFDDLDLTDNSHSDSNPLELPVFCDGFESGTTAAWSSVVP
jgi:uncharacterized repeat protein (TIGR01451 family)